MYQSHGAKQFEQFEEAPCAILVATSAPGRRQHNRAAVLAGSVPKKALARTLTGISIVVRDAARSLGGRIS
jgi:hypothetical protein